MASLSLSQLHASCHQQILRRLDSNPNILEEDAEHQALLLQSFAGSVGALSEEKRLCIIRAVRYAIPFWSHTPPCQVQRMRAVVWTPLKVVGLNMSSPQCLYGSTLSTNFSFLDGASVCNGRDIVIVVASALEVLQRDH